jgi:Tfp pilus assembly PilM family ATPase
MVLLRSRLLVALDAGSVAGTVASPGIGGTKMAAWVRAPLPPGALRPSPADANLIDLDAIGVALAAVRDALGARRRETVLLLPGGVARIALLEVPKGVNIRQFARFRIAQALPYPASEAVVDTLPVAAGRHLCGAVRRSVAQGYEAAAEAAGFKVGRVDVAPLVAIAGLKRLTGPGEAGMAVLLGDTDLSIAAFAEGSLAVFRTRVRAPVAGEAEWLQEELSRSASLAGSTSLGRIAVLGSGARSVAQSLRALGCDAASTLTGPSDADPSDSAERAWMGAAFA